MKNPNEHEFGQERVKTAQQRVITYSGRGSNGVLVLAPSPLRAPPVILAYHMDFGPPPKLCALWDKIPQNFWVGGMPHGYSRGSWCAFRVPEKTMFGRTNNVGFDPFSRYSGCTPLAALRPDCGRSCGRGRPSRGRSSSGKDS